VTTLRKRSFRPQLEILEIRDTPSVTVGTNFNALYNTGYNPPDTNVAVGPNYVVETVNSRLAIFTKTGSLVLKEDLSALFTGFTSGDNGMYDPSVLYDDQAGRFVIEAQVYSNASRKAYVDIAVSNSSDPTQGFGEIHQIEVDEGGLYWSDNGKIGYNADAYVFTGNMYPFGSQGAYHEQVLTIAKSTVLDQNNSTLTTNQVDLSGYVSLIPARMHGATTGGPMWLVMTYGSAASEVIVTRMDNVLSPSPTFRNYFVPVNPYDAPPSFPQPGGSVQIYDCRTLNVEWNNNQLVSGFNSIVGTDAAAAWLEFNTSGPSPTVMSQGAIAGSRTHRGPFLPK
jgi:hypothetical protein